MAVKLHTCPIPNVALPGHPCTRVVKALKEARIEHEIVKEPFLRPRRKDVIRMTGQRLLPFVEFEDGSVLREESKDLAARIRGGKLFEGKGGAAG